MIWRTAYRAFFFDVINVRSFKVSSSGLDGYTWKWQKKVTRRSKIRKNRGEKKSKSRRGGKHRIHTRVGENFHRDVDHTDEDKIYVRGKLNIGSEGRIRGIRVNRKSCHLLDRSICCKDVMESSLMDRRWSRIETVWVRISTCRTRCSRVSGPQSKKGKENIWRHFRKKEISKPEKNMIRKWWWEQRNTLKSSKTNHSEKKSNKWYQPKPTEEYQQLVHEKSRLEYQESDRHVHPILQSVMYEMMRREDDRGSWIYAHSCAHHSELWHWGHVQTN